MMVDERGSMTTLKLCAVQVLRASLWFSKLLRLTLRNTDCHASAYRSSVYNSVYNMGGAQP